MRLSLAPVPFYWPRERLLAFYEAVGAAPVDIVYLGETVCSKRRPLRTGEWLELARSLRALGKEVVLSSLTLIEAQSELSSVRKLVENGEFAVEANDMSAVGLLTERRLPFVAGNAINIYNGPTLDRLRRLGMFRWIMATELSRSVLADILGSREEPVETEVFAFGHLPLAWSARCFTARHHDLPKDHCEYKCLDYPTGMPVATQDDQQFLRLNGIQTLSTGVYDIVDQWRDMRDLGVRVLRIVPTGEAISGMFEPLRQMLDQDATELDLTPWRGTVRHQGFWHGEPGMM